MKNLLILSILSVMLFSCSTSYKVVEGSASQQNNQSELRDGSSFVNAIIIQDKSESTGISAEYEWLRQNYPGYQFVQQALTFKGKKPYDILTVKTSDGLQRKVYFDISNFYGKW